MEKLKEKQNRKKEKKQVSESQTPSPHPPKITPITIGEHVKIKGQSAIGEVLEINGKNTAVVGFGSIKIIRQTGTHQCSSTETRTCKKYICQ